MVLPKLLPTGGEVVSIDAELFTSDVFCDLVNPSIGFMKISMNFYHIFMIFSIFGSHCCEAAEAVITPLFTNQKQVSTS